MSSDMMFVLDSNEADRSRGGQDFQLWKCGPAACVWCAGGTHGEAERAEREGPGTVP